MRAPGQKWPIPSSQRRGMRFHAYCNAPSTSVPILSLPNPPDGGFGSDRIGTEVDGALQYAWKRIPLLWELGIGHFWPGALMSANNHGAQLTLARSEERRVGKECRSQ